jgi:hypothetical protein
MWPIIQFFGTITLASSSFHQGARMKKVLFGLTILMLIVAACAPQPAEQSLLPDDDSYPNTGSYPGGDSYPSDLPDDLTPAQQAAITHLSTTLNLPPGQITLISTEAVEWPDGCLGVQIKDLMCTQAFVSGYRIILQAGGELYEMRTNQSGSQVVRAAEEMSFDSVEDKVINQLASNLGLKTNQVTLLSSSEMEFGDTCLDVLLPDMQCAQVLMPGRLIVVSANGVEYEYHTSADGTFIQPAMIALTWKREGGIAGFCDSLVVFHSGEVYGNQCQSQPGNTTGSFASLLSAEEREQFDTWVNEIGSVDLNASDPEGVSDRMVVSLQFRGNGKGSLNQADEQAILLWVQTLFQKLYS